MRKRILSLLLVLAMIMSMIPAVSMTASAATFSVETTSGIKSYSSLEAAWTAAAGVDTATVTLLADAAANLTVPEGKNITLDLNGHVLTTVDENAPLAPIILNKGTLTVKDSDASAATHKTHYFEVCENDLWVLTDKTENAQDISSLKARPEPGAIIAVHGGVITGSNYSYGAVYNSCAALTVESGSFIGNNISVYNEDDGTVGSVVTVKDALMAGNSSSSGGSCISGADKISVEGGRYVFNTTESGGGAIYPINGELHVSGSTVISFNKAGNGGGIYALNSSVELSGSVQITDNIATGNGGGVMVTYDSYLEIRDSVLISDNSTDGLGGGIHITAQGNMGFESGASVGCIYGGTVTGNRAEGEGGGVFVGDGCSLEVKNASVTKNTSGTNGGGISVSAEEGGCFIEGTQITMADGSVKNIEVVQNGEMIRTFDHETGAVSFEKVCHKFSGEGTGTAFTLSFTDDIKLSIVGSHGLLEKESGKYVLIDADNALSFVGHHFYNADMDCWEELLGVSGSAEPYRFYALYSEHHINAVANHMLSVTDDALFRVNVFDFDDDMKIDAEKKQQDIDTYGLTSYEDFSEYTSEEEFYNFNNQYDHIAVCKGLTTAEDIIALTRTEEEAPAFMLMSSGSAGLLGGNMSYPLTLCSGANITDNTVNSKANNVYLAEDKEICISGNTPKNISAGLTTEIKPTSGANVLIVSDTAEDYTSFFKSDVDSYRVLSVKHGEDENAVKNIELCTRISEQPSPDNKYTVKVDMNGLPKGTKVAYQWYRVDGEESVLLTGNTADKLADPEAGETYFCTVTIADDEAVDTIRVDAWAYTASKSVETLTYNDTVTAYCGEDCTATDTTLILKASDATYDGNEHAALRVAEKADTTEAASFCGSSTLPALSYEKYNGTGWESVTGTPKAAGTYRASITVGDGTKAVTAFAEYTITKATPNVTAAPTASAITYGQTLGDSTLSGGTGSVAGTFSWKTPTAAPAVSDSDTTEYTVVFTPTDAENYSTVEFGVKLTVNKADNTLKMTVSGDTTACYTDVKTYTVKFEGKRPGGTAVVWDITGGTYEYVGDHIGTDSVTIICEDTGTLNINATLVDLLGRPVKDADGKIVQANLKVTVKPESGNIINTVAAVVKAVVKTLSKWFGR